MDMNCRKPGETKATQYMEQDDGITTAGKADPEPLIRLETSGKKGADPLRNIS